MGHSWAMTNSRCIPNLLFGMNGEYCNWPFKPHTYSLYIGNEVDFQYIGNHHGQYMGLSAIIAHSLPMARVVLIELVCVVTVSVAPVKLCVPVLSLRANTRLLWKYSTYS